MKHIPISFCTALPTVLLSVASLSAQSAKSGIISDLHYETVWT